MPRACCTSAAGSVIVTGIGKAGLIGAKISATLASTGTRSIFLHPAEAVHGDLGRIRADDVVLVLSQSGETEEVTRLLPSLMRLDVPVIAVTGRSNSTLARGHGAVAARPVARGVSAGHGPQHEHDRHAGRGRRLGAGHDAVAWLRTRRFRPRSPGRALGKQLACVEERMRPLAECRVARDSEIVRDVFAALVRPGRRSGAIMLVDASGALTGLFTDSDLARLFEQRRDEAIDQPIREVMTRAPCAVPAGSMLTDAVAILAERKISELPVIDVRHAPVGLLDITDVLAMMPDEAA